MNVCRHESCVYSSLQGLSHGFTYGAKIRFTHSLVIAILFSKEPYLKRIERIFSNTLEHGRRLGLYVFLFKTIVCILNKIRGIHSPIHHLISGVLASYAVWSKETGISMQITLYLLSRITIASVKVLYFKLGLNNKFIEKYGMSILTLLSWSSSMFLFDYDNQTLQASMSSSMKFLYRDSNSWKGWKECFLGIFKNLIKN